MNTRGHTFFIEDGIETHNIIEENLGLGTRPTFSLLNSDTTPATFWITNPNNIIRNNRAAGGDRYGFWFDIPLNPTGSSRTSSVCGRGEKLGVFEGNTAHSYGRYGLRIFRGHIPRERPCDDVKDDNLDDPWSYNPSIPAEYKDFTAFKNGRSGAVGEDVGDIRFIDFKVADHVLAGINMTFNEFSRPYESTTY
mmetsp:Transcript_26971/g.4964  ORF Transcript_26971/g.4964 Transcript_26971/m.4964 type:complete len:194 (+) Transcript_26971:5890-6471(+)